MVRVELHLCDVAQAVRQGELPAAIAELSPAEEAQRLRFRFEEDGQTYAVAHALVRRVLAERLLRTARALEFETGPNGRPELCDRALRFNLSHTRGTVALAVTERADVGVDVETYAPARATHRLASYALCAAELETFEGLAEEARPEQLFALWTLKEAFLKATGAGLSTPLRSFGFELGPEVRFAPPPGESAGDWQFRTLRAGAARVALAVRSREELAVRLVFRTPFGNPAAHPRGVD